MRIKSAFDLSQQTQQSMADLIPFFFTPQQNDFFKVPAAFSQPSNKLQLFFYRPPRAAIMALRASGAVTILVWVVLGSSTMEMSGRIGFKSGANFSG